MSVDDSILGINKLKCRPIKNITISKFLNKCHPTDENECWEWSGQRDKTHGYSRYQENMVLYQAHRVSYEIFKGIKNTNTVIDHICRNKKCVNPDYLRETDVRTNTLENSSCSAVQKKQQTHCIHGHEFTKQNTKISKGPIYGGIRRNCIKCAINTKAAWYRANKERLNKNSKKYYQENAERCKAVAKERYRRIKNK